ncbi:terminase small subunit [Gordonia phage Frokostdame]|uniref:Terminase small subunit n=1 Tax=Gordonia phage Frokostdame TaxID=2250320 RepID=A0A345L2Z1_9CAUD|nr:terminase small subunit [Gordonia phage Frokostdame]AXH49643.1 terminase small subunit [Gordonia phage Frokostdame]
MTLALEMTGSEVVSELSRAGDPVSVRIMIREVGRIVDRLAKLDLILTGDVPTWTKVVTGRDSVIEVRVDHALQEARQQQTSLMRLLAAIARHRGDDPGEGAGGDDDGLADL